MCTADCCQASEISLIEKSDSGGRQKRRQFTHLRKAGKRLASDGICGILFLKATSFEVAFNY